LAVEAVFSQVFDPGFYFPDLATLATLRSTNELLLSFKFKSLQQ
jgi:hypothetical protein